MISADTKCDNLIEVIRAYINNSNYLALVNNIVKAVDMHEADCKKLRVIEEILTQYVCKLDEYHLTDNSRRKQLINEINLISVLIQSTLQSNLTLTKTIKQLDERHKTELNRLVYRHNAELSNQKIKHNAELSNQQARHNNDLSRLKSQYGFMGTYSLFR